MAERLRVSWRGEQYEVVRKDGRDALPEPGPVWQVTRNGAPITSLPAQHRERPADIRDMVDGSEVAESGVTLSEAKGTIHHGPLHCVQGTSPPSPPDFRSGRLALLPRGIAR